VLNEPRVRGKIDLFSIFSLHAPDVVVQQRQPGSKYCVENMCVVRIPCYGVLDIVMSSMVQAFYMSISMPFGLPQHCLNMKV